MVYNRSPILSRVIYKRSSTVPQCSANSAKKAYSSSRKLRQPALLHPAHRLLLRHRLLRHRLDVPPQTHPPSHPVNPQARSISTLHLPPPSPPRSVIYMPLLNHPPLSPIPTPIFTPMRRSSTSERMVARNRTALLLLLPIANRLVCLMGPFMTTLFPSFP